VRILVTGASGFIASHLVRRLLKDGYTVAAMTRYGNIVKCSRLADVWDQLHIVEADLRNRGALKEAAAVEPEVIFHLAAYNHVGESFRQVEECFDVNAKGTANLFDCCPCRRFVYISSSEIYGKQETIPWHERMTPRPISPYAVSKYAGEQYCQAMWERKSNTCEIVLLRPFNTYGPGQSTKAVIPYIIKACLAYTDVKLTSGRQTREFNYISDTVEGIFHIGLGGSLLGSPVNIGCGNDISIEHLAKKIRELTASISSLKLGELPLRDTEIPVMAACNKLALQEGWSPAVGLTAGLKMTISSFES